MTELSVSEERHSKVVELPHIKANQLEDIAEFFKAKEDYDPYKEKYEFPITDQEPYTYDGIKSLGEFSKAEIKMLSYFDSEDQKWKSRAISGLPGVVSTESLNAVEDYVDFGRGKIYAVTKRVDGYPIVDDRGVVSGDLWNVSLHNHPDGDPYPSLGDIRGTGYEAEATLITSTAGLTTFGRIPNPHEINIPESLIPADYHGDDLHSRVIYLRQVSDHIEQNNPPEGDPNSDEYKMEMKKRVCEMAQIPHKILSWEEDRVKIEQLLTNINNRQFVAKDFFQVN